MSNTIGRLLLLGRQADREPEGGAVRRIPRVQSAANTKVHGASKGRALRGVQQWGLGLQQASGPFHPGGEGQAAAEQLKRPIL